MSDFQMASGESDPRAKETSGNCWSQVITWMTLDCTPLVLAGVPSQRDDLGVLCKKFRYSMTAVTADTGAQTKYVLEKEPLPFY